MKEIDIWNHKIIYKIIEKDKIDDFKKVIDKNKKTIYDFAVENKDIDLIVYLVKNKASFRSVKNKNLVEPQLILKNPLMEILSFDFSLIDTFFQKMEKEYLKEFVDYSLIDFYASFALLKKTFVKIDSINYFKTLERIIVLYEDKDVFLKLMQKAVVNESFPLFCFCFDRGVTLYEKIDIDGYTSFLDYIERKPRRPPFNNDFKDQALKYINLKNLDLI